MKELFDRVSVSCSKITTNQYSTSFSLGVKLLGKEIRNPIYAIYGFVRFADEIVDTFTDYDKSCLLNEFKKDTYKAIKQKISLNPILNAFQDTVNRYHIDTELIETFLKSMEMDLNPQSYNREKFEEYILGSAEVVGLMCLNVFCNGDKMQYEQLSPFARSLGAAFQKINFLRDVKEDFEVLGRSYFPSVNLEKLTQNEKNHIEREIEADFQNAFKGIKRLPNKAKFGVYLAYIYYYALFKKIQSIPPSRIMEERIRIPNIKKYSLLLSSYIRFKLNII